MTRILAVLDPREKTHHALERCKGVSADADFEIHAVYFMENESAASFSTKFAENTAWLNEQVLPYTELGYSISTEVIPFHSLYESVIEAAEKFEADYVLKPMRQHSLFQTMVRTTTDWNLIRHCPYPLMLISEIDEIKGKPMLAAIDANSGDENHESLNDIVLSRTTALSAALGSDVHLVNAWRVTTPMMAVGSLDSTPYPTPADLHKDHMKACQEVADRYDLPESSVHVAEGTAAQVINQTARDIDAGLVVIGTVARKGLSGALIGNTAESVLESTNCDVLVVKLND